ncbi:L-idonate 5-dehydrogenase [Mesorhizobium sp. 10J20-29]
MRAVFIHAAKDIRIAEIPESSVGPYDVAVRIRAAGICGSDLHYYLHGGFGPIRLQEPLILGHEMSGEVVSLGSSVSNLAVGARVAINPSQPCYRCHFCLRAEYRHCSDMRFFGSAMRFPHVQGGFRETLIVPARQAYPIDDDVSFEEAALGEPLAVCLHAARRAQLGFGQKVLVTGCGPIGTLCIALARLAGAQEIVATDVSDFPLELARRMGADRTINVASNPDGLAPYNENKGKFDVLFEASANESAIKAGIDAVRPGGVVVQLGLGGSIPIPINSLVAKEIEFRGTFRFDREFGEAVDMINSRVIDIASLITTVLPFTEAPHAFELAADRRAAMKVQLSFG